MGGEANHQFGAINEQLDAHKKSLKHLSVTWKKLPEIEAHHTDLRSRFDDMIAGARVQIEEHISHSKAVLEKQLHDMSREVATSKSHVEVHVLEQVQAVGSKLDRAIARLEDEAGCRGKELE